MQGEKDGLYRPSSPSFSATPSSFRTSAQSITTSAAPPTAFTRRPGVFGIWRCHDSGDFGKSLNDKRDVGEEIRVGSELLTPVSV